MRYETVEHTADQAIRAFGRDLRELIENAAAGMISLLYVEAPPAPTATVSLTTEADAPEMLLHHALRELLYLLEDEALAPVRVTVTEAHEQYAALNVGVVNRAVAEPLFAAPIKAVTYHGLQIVRDGGLLHVTVVFDV